MSLLIDKGRDEGSNFGFVSDFVLRASDLPAGSWAELLGKIALPVLLAIRSSLVV